MGPDLCDLIDTWLCVLVLGLVWVWAVCLPVVRMDLSGRTQPGELRQYLSFRLGKANICATLLERVHLQFRKAQEDFKESTRDGSRHRATC
jgi:hypothetical protein